MFRFPRFLNFLRGPVYKCFLIFGDSGGTPLWNYEKWLKAAAALDDVFALVARSISVRSDQLVNAGKRNQKGVRFGRLEWDATSFQKWCHDSPITKEACREWNFCGTEVFSPSWSDCAKNSSLLPIVYILVADESYREDDVQKIYDQLCLVVVRESFWHRNKKEVNSCVQRLASIAGGLRIITGERSIMFQNEFESIYLHAIYRGMHLDPLPDPSKMKGRWKEVSFSDRSSGT